MLLPYQTSSTDLEQQVCPVHVVEVAAAEWELVADWLELGSRDVLVAPPVCHVTQYFL